MRFFRSWVVFPSPSGRRARDEGRAFNQRCRSLLAAPLTLGPSPEGRGKTRWPALLLLLLLAPAGQAAATLFDPIASVLQHPRCMNCHTVTDFPRQGDERKRHAQRVIRGEDGHGAPTLQCAACHQETNIDHGGVPGAPHWHLAPLGMAWEGLNNTQLCETLKDRSRNGDRDVDALIEHMRSDALVLWGWSPGAGRTLPPLTHPQFMQALEAWRAAGSPC